MLANATTAKTDDLIAQNASSYARSRNLFIGVAAGAIVLALLLGFVLSWSLIGPIQRIDARLAAIASGDFSGHVDVSNRDELGALAANVNRMNDELRRLYRELEATSRHKSEFLANMSHELRTPLNAIIGFSQVLRERMFGEVNEKQEEYLDDILSSGNHLLSLINDVLDLSKVEAGQVELEVAPFSLREALERGVVMVRERATKDGVQVALAPDPDVDVVEGDERRIKQVIFNLLSNAVKFTPAGGAVDVSAARVNGEVRVSVADTGPGHRPRGPRADLRGVPADRGGGRAARGDRPRPRALEAARRAARRPDLGRQRARQGEHVRVHAAREVGLAMAGERILVVEDNEMNMKLFRDVLLATGYRTLEATTGEEAVELATEHAPDLVLMDIQLPDIDGVEALRRLRADERTASIPVLALTAQAMQGDRERFLAAGFDGYVSKPVNVVELIGTVRQHCGEKESMRAVAPPDRSRAGQSLSRELRLSVRRADFLSHNGPRSPYVRVAEMTSPPDRLANRGGLGGALPQAEIDTEIWGQASSRDRRRGLGDLASAATLRCVPELHGVRGAVRDARSGLRLRLPSR